MISKWKVMKMKTFDINHYIHGRIFTCIALINICKPLILHHRLVNAQFSIFFFVCHICLLLVLTQLCTQPDMMNMIYTPPPAALKRNRYINVLPNKDTRVKLRGDKTNDYINASFVTPNLPGCHTTYIAAQAPIPITITDWWRMVWEQHVTIILMLTKDKERDRNDTPQIKAHIYWPEQLNESTVYGPYTLTLKRSSYADRTIIERVFTIATEKEPMREIIHLQYVGWVNTTTQLKQLNHHSI